MKLIFLYFSILAGLSSCAINKSIHFNDEINYNSYWHEQNELQTPFELEKSLRESMAYETESVYNGIDKKYFFNSQIAKSNFNNEDIDSSYNFIINKLKNFYCDRRFNKVEIALEGPVIIKMTESNGRIDKEISFALDWKESERSFFRLSVTVLNNSKIINSTAMGLFRSSNCYNPLSRDELTILVDTISPFKNVKHRSMRRIYLDTVNDFVYRHTIISTHVPIFTKKKIYTAYFHDSKIFAEFIVNHSEVVKKIKISIRRRRKKIRKSLRKFHSPRRKNVKEGSDFRLQNKNYRYTGRYSGKKIK